MINRWAIIPAITGAGVLVAIACLVLAAISREEVEVDVTAHAAGGESVPVWQQFHDGEERFSLFYPASWELEREGQGVALYNGASGDDPQAARASFFLSYDGIEEVEDALGVSLAVTDSLSSDLVRTAENVSVGGVSGVETVSELELEQENVPLTGRIDVDRNGMTHGRMVVVVWRSTGLDGQLWIIMADTDGGRHLHSLKRIRESIEWQQVALNRNDRYQVGLARGR